MRHGFTPIPEREFPHSDRKNLRLMWGFTIVELLIVMGIIVVVALSITLNLVGRRSQSELNLTTQRIAALLRQAQSRSLSQVSSTAWGVHLDNGSAPLNAPFYALFAGATYASSSEDSHFALPTTLKFGNIAAGGAANVFFSQVSGGASGSTSVNIYMVNTPTTSSTISIDPSGSIAY